MADLLWTAQGERSGVALDMSIGAAYRFEGGKIAEARSFWAWEDALAATGLGDLTAL